MVITELEPKQQLQTKSWLTVTQEMINKFAEATGDYQWIHLDEAACKARSPFGTTIAHGFLTASLLPQQFSTVISIDPKTQTLINYGMERLRFLEPVRSGDRIKFSFELLEKSEKTTGQLHKFSVEVAIQGREKPALVGVFLMLLA